MRSINKKRAEIIWDIMEGSENNSVTVDFIVTVLMANCASYHEVVLCSNECTNETILIPIVRLHTSFNPDFSNLASAIADNYSFKCPRCHKEEGNSIEITYGPVLVIEVCS